jgi:peptide/nickel transport system ATP-binding protein
MSEPSPVLVSVSGVTKQYTVPSGWFRRAKLDAVRGVDLEIHRGEIVALVGESGSGKSTLGRILVRLTKATAGQVIFDGIDVNRLEGRKLREYRKRVGIVFQNPYRSLSARMTVGQLIAEPLRVWKVVPRDQIPAEVARLLDSVALPRALASRHPHALSGGQRQRVAIARVLSVRPEFLVADEAVSALDVSAAAGVINLLLDLRANLGLTGLFATHDLSVAGILADRIAVMNKGEIVEIGTPEELLKNPQHPYTKLLVAAQLRVDEDAKPVELEESLRMVADAKLDEA